MVITETIKVKVSKKNIDHFKLLGYDFNLSEIVEIPTMHLNHGSHILINVKCDICGNEKIIAYQKYIKNIKNGNFYACSSKCAQEKVKITSIKKFGAEYYTQTDEYKKKVKDTSILNYGVEHHVQSKTVKEKAEKTNVEKYGSKCVFSSNVIKNKIKQTNIKYYGDVNPSNNEEIKNKISCSLKNKWREKNLEYYKDLNIIDINSDEYEFICDCNKNHNFKINKTLLNNRRLLKTTICTICFPPNSYTSSGLEIQLREFINDNYNGKIIFNDKKQIKPNELDIYLPELNMAIEFNGVYWHCELEKPNDYHLMKYNKCKDAGIELIQIWQDDWIYKQDIIKSILLNKLKIKQNIIYARNCVIEEISNKDAINFLEKNHLQGKINGKINIGLYFKNELVSLMVFSGLRKALGSKPADKNYELLRYCNKLNTSILGGAGKMLSYFKKNYKFESLITYFDKSLGFNNLYEKIGFKYIYDTKPNYYYLVDGIRKHRYNYRKDILVKEGYDPFKTEKEIMFERKIFRIFDVGNKKYIFNK